MDESSRERLARMRGDEEGSFEVLVIGGGFAGTAAAINLARARRKVCIIDDGKPRNRSSERMHGVLGSDGVRPTTLLERGHTEFAAYGGVIFQDRVESLARVGGNNWVAETESGRSLTASQTLVATGITDSLPEVPGLRDMWGSRVFHCPYCHGYEATGKSVGVIGGKNPAFTFKMASLLTKWSESVTLHLNGLDPTKEQLQKLEATGVVLDRDGVVRVSPAAENDTSVEVMTASGTIRYDACFTGPDFIPNDQLLRKAGCTVVDGWVSVEGGKTSQLGLWAVSNVVSSPDQVSQAIGTGAGVAIAIDQFLFDEEFSG